MFTIDFTKPFLYKDVIYFNQGNLATNNILRCKLVTGGDETLEGYIATATFKTLSHPEINGTVNIVDAKNCIVDIKFPSNSLEVGVNELEVILTKGEGIDKVVTPSPVIKYEVWQCITTGNGIQGDNKYPVLIDLISKVNNTIRIANNASATADVSLKQAARMIEEVDNTLIKANNTINATNNAKDEALNAADEAKKAIAAGTQDLEVKNARGKYESLNDRLNALDKDLLKSKEISIIPVTTESNFVTVEETSNGYFEDVKLEGRTLNNILPNNKLRASNGTNFIINKPWNEFSNIKPNTKYCIKIFDPFGVVDSFWAHTLSVEIATMGTEGVITTKSDLSTATSYFHVYPNTKDPNAFTQEQVDKIQIVMIEGEKQEINSYFEGVKSVGDGVDEIVVTSMNKITKRVGKFINTVNFTISDDPTSVSFYIENIVAGQEYKIEFGNNDRFVLATYNSLESGSRPIENTNVRVNSFIPKENAKYMIVHLSSTQSDSVYCKIYSKLDKKKVLYYDIETQTWKKPILREWDSIEKHGDDKYYYHERSGERSYQIGDESNSNVITDKANTVYKLNKEKVYECNPIDLISFEGETNYLIESGAISPKSTFKCVGFIGNIISVLKEKVSYLEDKLYKTNLANFTVALNALDTKLKLEQLTKTPR
ncbi:Uncharacterised protein [uncultured Clostridium sp.]|nr:Uncharacterised protein [uncultured Clostridium sp.]SCI95250.1 Uncharacterised protein [uncultured Clostridium sp.]